MNVDFDIKKLKTAGDSVPDTIGTEETTVIDAIHHMSRSDALPMASHVTPAVRKIISLEQRLPQTLRKILTMRGP